MRINTNPALKVKDFFLNSCVNQMPISYLPLKQNIRNIIVHISNQIQLRTYGNKLSQS